MGMDYEYPVRRSPRGMAALEDHSKGRMVQADGVVKKYRNDVEKNPNRLKITDELRRQKPGAREYEDVQKKKSTRTLRNKVAPREGF